MTLDDAIALRTKLQALLASYAGATTSDGKAGLISQMLVMIDPVREFFRPTLLGEFTSARDAVVNALLTQCDGSAYFANDLAMQTPGLKRLRQRWNNFADSPTPAMITDAGKAVDILTTFIGS
jgi:hypothetical protein